jgi:hypothetical protein
VSNFRIRFGNPHHGWLPVLIAFADRELEFEASDVPNNCIENLVDALFVAARNAESEVWWSLEPAAYHFGFFPNGDLIELKISHCNDFRGRKVEVLTVQGTKSELLLSLWRSIRHFQSLNAVEPHWPPVRYGDLELLKQKILS